MTGWLHRRRPRVGTSTRPAARTMREIPGNGLVVSVGESDTDREKRGGIRGSVTLKGTAIESVIEVVIDVVKSTD